LRSLPYKREGAGLTLAALYLEEKNIEKDTLLNLIQASINATEIFAADSITKELKIYQSFYLCNRLFLLNLSAIYTTGFECPDTARIIPELRLILDGVDRIYTAFNKSFPERPLTGHYLTLYKKLLAFVNMQSLNYSEFDNFIFIKEFINPLFAINQ